MVGPVERVVLYLRSEDEGAGVFAAIQQLARQEARHQSAGSPIGEVKGERPLARPSYFVVVDAQLARRNGRQRRLAQKLAAIGAGVQHQSDVLFAAARAAQAGVA